MRADREINALADAQQFFGNLHTRGSRSHHKHRSIRHLSGIAIRAGVDLHNSGVAGYYGRDDRDLECSSRRDHV